jgi:hypothetical protein
VKRLYKNDHYLPSVGLGQSQIHPRRKNMDRRNFIASVGGLTLLGWAGASKALAEQSCVQLAPNLSRCTAGIPSEKFTAMATQQSSEWCWAACIEMIFTYYKHRVPQARIVEETWGGIVNMPGLPQQILSDLNRTWKDTRGKNFSVSGDVFSVSAENAVGDLQEDRPLIIGSLGHAVVLTALTSDVNTATGAFQVVAATVRDPWPGRGKRILTPAEWYNINFAARIVVEDADDE